MTDSWGLGSGAAAGGRLVTSDEFARTVDERVEEIAVAALDSAMYWHMRDSAVPAVPGWADDAAVHIDGDPQNGWRAYFGIAPLFVWVRRYPSPLTGATPSFDARYLGFDVPDGAVDDKVEPEVPAGLLEEYRAALQEAFEPWRSLQAPEGIVTGTVVPIMDGMYLVSDEPSALSGSSKPPVLANKDYHDLLARFGDATPHLKGVAMEYFKSKYVRQLDVVIPNLQYVMGEIAEAALGNALAVQRARKAVLAVLDAAIVAMERAKPGADYSGYQVALGILGAVVSAAAAFATGGAAIPFIAGLGGGLIGTLAGSIPDGDPADISVTLGAEKPTGVLENIRSALATTDRELLTEEQAAAYAAFDQIDLLNATPGPGQPDPFRLEEPDETRGPLIQADRANMAVLWDTLPLIAARLRKAAALLDGAVGNDAVFRHGSVGRSVVGAQQDIAAAGQEAWTALRALAEDLDEGAQGLRDLWRDFSDTDGLTRGEFADIKRELA